MRSTGGKAWSWPEDVARVIEQSGGLNSLGKTLGVGFATVVRPGAVKDLLSGTWLGHPAHPMLTDLPIGAWTSAFLLDVLGGEPSRRAADALVGVGVLAALPTALTGLSDLSDIVNEEERSVGTAHALGNTLTLVLYGVSYLARRRGSRRTGIALSVLGATALTGAGFLGGHLAYRRGIGVDQTAFETRFDDWTAVLAEDDLPEDKPRRVMVSGTNVMLYRHGGRIHALANRCTHRGGPLHKGRFEGGNVTCPWHRSTFRLEDGSIVRGPATAPQPSYEVRVQQGTIEVRTRR